MTANVAVMSNRKGGQVDLYFSANGYALCSGNSTTSNVNGSSTCLAISEETISNMYIREIFYSTSNAAAYWTVSRGANAYFTLGNNDGWMNFAADGEGFQLDATANVVVTLTGTATGFIILKMKKNGTYTEPE